MIILRRGKWCQEDRQLTGRMPSSAHLEKSYQQMRNSSRRIESLYSPPSLSYHGPTSESFTQRGAYLAGLTIRNSMVNALSQILARLSASSSCYTRAGVSKTTTQSWTRSGNAFEVVNQVKIRGLANGSAKSAEDGLEFVRMRIQWKKAIGWERMSTDRSHTKYRLQFARVGYGFSRAEQATPESRPRTSSFAGGGRGAVWVNLFFFL